MKEIVKDYFGEFYRGFKLARLGLLAYIAIGSIYYNWTELKYASFLMGLPILYAIFSGAFHLVSLPFMMYLIPYNQKMREAYIQKMLVVKMAIPLGFALLCDGIAFLLGEVSIYAFILQLLSVFCISYICGTLNDGTINATEKKAAYGGMQDFIGVMLMMSYVGGTIMAIVCMGHINKIEFLVILSFLFVIFCPIMLAIHKRWKQIRANFANYEMATKLEART